MFLLCTVGQHCSENVGLPGNNVKGCLILTLRWGKEFKFTERPVKYLHPPGMSTTLKDIKYHDIPLPSSFHLSNTFGEVTPHSKRT